MKQTDISVNVCTYNRAEMLRGALESLICQKTDGKFSYEIVVVDNASKDDTKAVVEQVSKNSRIPIRYIIEENKGVAQARNRGVKESQGAWIALFDDDQLAESDWLYELYDMASETGVNCIGGPYFLRLKEQELNRLTPTLRSILGDSQHGKKKRRCNRKTVPLTGNALVKKTVFDIVGNFDNTMTGGGEDTDFFCRVLRAGFEIWFTPKAKIYHIIPSYRLKDDYFLWTSTRWGCNIAKTNYKEWGLTCLLMLCIARIGQALLINLPFMCWGYIKLDDEEILSRKCLLLRALGYTRETLYLFAPRLFQQENFFAGSEFRRERLYVTEFHGHFGKGKSDK